MASLPSSSGGVSVAGVGRLSWNQPNDRRASSVAAGEIVYFLVTL
jgi:hypothetical protein